MKTGHTLKVEQLHEALKKSAQARRKRQQETEIAVTRLLKSRGSRWRKKPKKWGAD